MLALLCYHYQYRVGVWDRQSSRYPSSRPWEVTESGQDLVGNGYRDGAAGYTTAFLLSHLEAAR